MPVLEMLLLIGALVVSAVFLHYEGLHRLDRWAERNARLGASRLYFIVLAILAVHVGEVLVYAGGFALGARAGLGHLEGVAAPELPRLSVYAFVSAEIFTSLGFGDLYPTGWLRLVAGVECLNGLILIGWSSSFTYLAMRRFWQTVTGSVGRNGRRTTITRAMLEMSRQRSVTSRSRAPFLASGRPSLNQ